MVLRLPEGTKRKREEAMRAEFLNLRPSDEYATRQLNERHRDLEFLEFEREVVGMSPPDYQSCRRSLLQAIDELEALLQPKS
jgi:hypothetical protein